MKALVKEVEQFWLAHNCCRLYDSLLSRPSRNYGVGEILFSGLKDIFQRTAIFGCTATCQKLAELHLGSTGMSGDDLPTVIKLLKIHCGIADNLGVRTREFDAPPRQGKSQVRLEEFNLDAAWIDEPHGATIRVTVHVRIVKLLPTVKLLRIDHNQEIRGFPIDVQMSVNVVGVPSIEHFKQ
jgi:hypothetical protein